MFQIVPLRKEPVTGETCSGKACRGEAQVFMVKHLQDQFTATIRYTYWENGERDITCLEAKGHDVLHTVIGRMRLSVMNYSDTKDSVSLKTAVLIRPQLPYRANLHQRPPDYYHDELGIDLHAELARFGPCKLDTKELLLNETGKSKNEYCLLFEKDHQLLPVAAFVMTRIMAIPVLNDLIND